MRMPLWKKADQIAHQLDQILDYPLRRGLTSEEVYALNQARQAVVAIATRDFGIDTVAVAGEMTISADMYHQEMEKRAVLDEIEMAKRFGPQVQS